LGDVDVRGSGLGDRVSGIGGGLVFSVGDRHFLWLME
jgi:hypothetical protein